MANASIDLDIYGRGLTKGAHGFGEINLTNDEYGRDFSQAEALGRLREVSMSGTRVRRRGDFIDRDFDGRPANKIFGMYSSRRLSCRVPKKSNPFQLAFGKLVNKRHIGRV